MRRFILPTVFAFSFCTTIHAADTAPALEPNKWTEISAKVLADLDSAKKKIGYPGKVAGIACDATGTIYMVVPDNGIYTAPANNLDFRQIDSSGISGRCETGGSLQLDPAGGRLTCFMLDGKSAMTLDAGKTWKPLAPMGRGWDYASVDWADKNAATILAMHHESGGQLYLSTDAGKSWNKFAKDEKFSAVGTFDANTFITAKSTGGISRTEDAGKTWKQVSDLHVTSHVVTIYKDKAYLLAKEGLIVSADKGATWKVQGAALEATFGPLFNDKKDEKHMIVWGKKGIYETTNAGEEWKLILTYPDDFKKKFNIEWYTNVGWDTATDTFFLSHMGLSAWAWKRAEK